MADPFVGEIRMFGGNFAPRGWATCDGQLLAIAQIDLHSRNRESFFSEKDPHPTRAWGGRTIV